ncbi:hypothetical protein AYO44_08920 [Planctomycetaceae bacterium SCGC AG-212-F19]|nr:hypothetical protein AYO44_08920 [Planctomycetaceae bacterium SCGC AG-212-F19]
MPVLIYRPPPPINDFFQEHVVQSFKEHKRSTAWTNEVTKQDWKYHTRMILDRGRADFRAEWKGLTPSDKIVLYCYYYMQMHAVSGYHTFRRGRRDHRLDFLENVVFIDFGCGPLTSAVSLAWHNLKINPNSEKQGLLIYYIGIDNCSEMLSHAKAFANESNLFHRKSTFNFVTRKEAPDQVPLLIEECRSRLKGAEPTIILNCSYYFASRTLGVGGLITFISQLLTEHLVDDKVCLVFQNPDHDGLNLKWERFKNGMKLLRELSRNTDTVYYRDITGQRSGIVTIHLRREFLINRKWMKQGDVVQF